MAVQISRRLARTRQGGGLGGEKRFGVLNLSD